jgi:hypothetical protein
MGAEVRIATTVMTCQSTIGCQPASQRMKTTSPKPSPKKRAVIQMARSQPGWVR